MDTQSLTSLRNLKTNEKHDFSTVLMDHIAAVHKCDAQVQKSEYFGVCIFSGASSTDILKTLNKSILPQLNRFIEDVLDSNPAYYNRTNLLFESEVTQDRLIVRWAL